MLRMLIAYDNDGNIVATLDYMVAKNENGEVIGLIDFEEVERTGPLTDVWNVSTAKGSGTWPEWLGARAHDFKVERSNDRIVGLIHKGSGHRRDRAEIEAKIDQRIKQAKGPADIRDIVGGPDRPIFVDKNGRNERPKGKPTNLPTVRRRT